MGSLDSRIFVVGAIATRLIALRDLAAAFQDLYLALDTENPPPFSIQFASRRSR